MISMLVVIPERLLWRGERVQILLRINSFSPIDRLLVQQKRVDACFEPQEGTRAAGENGLAAGARSELLRLATYQAVPGEIISFDQQYQSHQHPRFLTFSASRIDQEHPVEIAFTFRYTISTMPGLTSASGVLGFLSDEEPELKVFALQTLNDDIDTLWTEVAGSIGQM
jgi:hypothetical protein